MIRKHVRAMIVAGVFVVSGCATTGPSEGAGMVIGGIIGGVLGHQVGDGSGQAVATVVGTLIGASVGGAVGRSMDEVDRMRMNASLETVRTGVTTTWSNPDSGYDYAVTPTRTWETDEGPCREYTMEAEIGGRTEQIYGTACRQPDGSWRIVD